MSSAYLTDGTGRIVGHVSYSDRITVRNPRTGAVMNFDVSHGGAGGVWPVRADGMPRKRPLGETHWAWIELSRAMTEAKP